MPFLYVNVEQMGIEAHFVKIKNKFKAENKGSSEGSDIKRTSQ